MKKLWTIIFAIGILYFLLMSYVAVFHYQPKGEPAWVEWEQENNKGVKTHE